MDAQYTATAGDLISVLGVPRVLFKIAGQAAVSVRGGAEGGLDTPAERQRREAGGPGFARGYLEIDLMAFCDGIHGGAGIDGIDLDVLGCEPVLGRAFQEEIRRPGVMDVGRGDEYRQHQAQRAGQDRALDPLDLLVAVETALAFLRPGHETLVQNWPRRWHCSDRSGIGASRSAAPRAACRTRRTSPAATRSRRRATRSRTGQSMMRRCAGAAV